MLRTYLTQRRRCHQSNILPNIPRPHNKYSKEEEQRRPSSAIPHKLSINSQYITSLHKTYSTLRYTYSTLRHPPKSNRDDYRTPTTHSTPSGKLSVYSQHIVSP
uniref:Uncharacterized protein n=1 Tax=Cacopsylla melanoneura TaxID=428564 RepID=A0A8D8LEA4_9HEMI